MRIICPKCRNVIDDDTARFCPKCGTDLLAATEDWTCKNCGQINFADATFCKSCGESREKQTKFFYSAKFRYALAVIAVALIGGLGSYFYFNSANEGKYLTNYAAAARDLNDVNGAVVNSIKLETLKSSKPETLAEQMQAQKNILDAQEKIFSEMTPFRNYERQHADLIALVHKEGELVGQVIQVVSNPLDANAENSIAAIKDNIAALKTLGEQIKVPNTSLVSGVNLASVPEQLSLFVAEQKQINAAKMAKLAANQDFFRQMDDAIHRYDGAKAELGKILDSNKTSGMIWADYFNVLDRAKSDRIGVRNIVNDIAAPEGTEDLKRSFRAVLDSSISYCELMREAANLGFNNYYLDRLKKENAAKDLNAQVQREYAAFIDRYGAAKRRLTNPNNL